MKRVGLKTVEVNLKSMNVKQLSFTMTIMATLMVLPLCSAPPSPPPQKDSLNSTLNQLKTSLSTLRNTVQNHETEIRTFEQKLETQETHFESIQEELTAKYEGQETAIKNFRINLESKTTALETTLNSLVNDLRQIKQQGNESVDTFVQYKQKLLEVEKILNTQSHQIEMQNQQIAQLENALKSLMALLNSKDTLSLTSSASSSSASSSSTQSNGTYKVQSGDNLEKIARKHNISLKALKEANQNCSDRIFVGQTLNLPQ
jgi:LysM repeat protein